MFRLNQKIEDILFENGRIDKDELEEAKQKQKASLPERPLSEVLISEGYITERQLMEAFAEQIGSDFIDLFDHEINHNVLNRFPLNLLENAAAVPFEEDESTIHIVTYDPFRHDAIERLERMVPEKELKIYIGYQKDIEHIFQRILVMRKIHKLVQKVKRESIMDEVQEQNEESAVMKLIRLIVQNAVEHNASDLHIEPDSQECSVRIRVDGILNEIFVFDLMVYSALASRIKILGNLDISERRKAQDGRFELSVDGNTYDFRLSTTPTLHGESIVMRILDRQKALLKLDELGFTGYDLRQIELAIHQPYGIVLVTGPTGSGKTTTLYAILNEVKSIENKVMTAEDPIEYQLSRIQQVQVNEKIDFGFAEALRSFLRQDPDIIMVGEIRDLETLNAAAQASLTGHLVLSTLHTNDSPGAINRMIHMGLESYLVADALLAVVSQRLVRKICSYCKIEVKPVKNKLNRVERYLPEDAKFYEGRGCMHCEKTGYLGRTIISEVLSFNTDIAELIMNNGSKAALERIAEQHNLYRPMIVDGINKVMDGVTTLDEILRVTRS